MTGPIMVRTQKSQAVDLIRSGSCAGVSSAAVRLNLPRAVVLAECVAAGICDEDGNLFPSYERSQRVR